MAQNDMLKRYLDAGVAFTKMNRTRAEGIVNDFVKAGEIRREQAQQRVDDLVDRSRRNTEALVDMVRRELQQQLAGMGLATKADIKRIEGRIDALARSGGNTGGGNTSGNNSAPAKAAAPKKAAPAKPAPAKSAKATKATKATKKA